MLKKTAFLLPLILLAALVFPILMSSGDEDRRSEEKVKVLYVTHEPGRYHDYTAQRAVFAEIAAGQPWEVTVMSGEHDEMVEALAGDPDFGAEADVIVYNICMAKSMNLMVPHHILQQTEELGKPAMLIHCALHSFWGTYKEDPAKGAVHSPGAHAKAHALPATIEAWEEAHPDVRFPAWPNLTGIASTRHGPKGPVESIKALEDHPIIAEVEAYTSVDGSELYNNFVSEEEAEDTTGILLGRQGETESFILWEKRHPKARVVSYTMGHSTAEWHEEPFQQIIANTVNYLAAEGVIEE